MGISRRHRLASHLLVPMAVSSVLAVGLLATSLAPAGAVVQPSLPGPISGWSNTTGTDGRVYLADEHGRARQFHGMNHKTDDPDTLTDTLLAAAAERGLDHVRLSIFWDALEPTEGTFDEAYLDRYVAAVDRAASHGLLVIVDFHQDVYGTAFGSRGIPTWATRTDGLPFTPQSVWLLNYLQPAVQAAWEHLYEDADLRGFQNRAWLHIVERVKHNPAILGYDLLNEPFGKIRDGEDFFTAAARVERVQLTAMYQRLTDAIAAVDPHHWVFIEPPNLASLGVTTSLGPVNGPKVALYPHMYDASIEAATYTPGGEIVYDPTFFQRWKDAITVYPTTYRVPMLVGEWGIAHPDAVGMDRFVRDSLATLDQATSGWSMFNGCLGEGYCPIDAAGHDRPGIGQIFQPYARAVAGAPTSSTWDPSTGVLRVRFTDNTATGATEIFVPESRSYPAGWQVVTSDPAGSFSSTFDAATGVVSVTTAKTASVHAICVVPAGATVECTATDPVPATPTTTASGSTAPSTGATTPSAVVATPRFTG